MDTPRAVAAAVTAARRAGIDVDDPKVLYERHGLIVHLRPSDLVARVERTASAIDRIERGETTIAFARHVADRRAPVVLPFEHAGPHVEDGVRMTFWTFARRTGPPDPRASGEGLRALHDAAASFEAPLPFYDPRPEALAVCEVIERAGHREPAKIVRRAAERLELPDVPAQPLHGDAHLSNVIQTAAGPQWIDFEVCAGPREWDLACLVHRSVVLGSMREENAAALAAYGDHDAEVVGLLVPAVTLWIAAWAAYADSLDGPGLNDWTSRRLEWLAAR